MKSRNENREHTPGYFPNCLWIGRIRPTQIHQAWDPVNPMAVLASRIRSTSVALHPTIVRRNPAWTKVANPARWASTIRKRTSVCQRSGSKLKMGILIRLRLTGRGLPRVRRLPQARRIQWQRSRGILPSKEEKRRHKIGTIISKKSKCVEYGLRPQNQIQVQHCNFYVIK